MKNKSGLRLATWNIHMSVGRDGRRDLNRTIEVIRHLDADVIGLQEVDNYCLDNRDDLALLATGTGLDVTAGPTMRKTTGDYGNALLTRLPVLDVEREEISVPRREPRGLLIAHLDWQGERLRVAVTHLGLRAAERRTQVRQLIHHLSGDDRTPLILLGDFNEWLFWGRPLRWLHHHFGRTRSPATFPSGRPLFRLDHILSNRPDRLSRLETYDSELSRSASDHLPLTALYRR